MAGPTSTSPTGSPSRPSATPTRRVTAAIHAQVDRLIGPINAIGFTAPISELAAALAATFPDPLDSVMFLNSGSEAIDGALKLARRVTGRPGIIAFRGGFHGRTFGATSVTTSNLNYRTGYEPLLPGVQFAPYPVAYPEFDGDEEVAAEASLAALESLLGAVIAPSTVAAVLIEPVLGEGGYNPAPTSFLRELRALCDRHGILLIADEVQSGYGRTGKMWAFEHAGIVPDVVCVAKAIANGLPLSAIVSSRELQDRWGRGAHGSTFGGNPVACAAGLAVLETIRDEGLLANAQARGAELVAGLGKIAAEDDRIGDIRGIGLMVGVEFTRDRATGERDATLPDSAHRRLCRRRAARAHLRPGPRDGPLDPAPRRQRGRDRRGGRDLRGDARVDPAGLSPGAVPRTARCPTNASSPAWPRSFETRSASGPVCRPRDARSSAVLGEELHDVVQPKPAIATLAHSVEGKLSAIAESLHRVDVQVKHVSHLCGGEHRSQFIDGHRCHVVFSLALHSSRRVRVHEVLRGRVRPAARQSV